MKAVKLQHTRAEVDQRRFRCSWGTFSALICWWNWLSRMASFLIFPLKSTGDRHRLAPSNPFSDTGWEINPGRSRAWDMDAIWPLVILCGVWTFGMRFWQNVPWQRHFGTLCYCLSLLAHHCDSFAFVQHWIGDFIRRCKCIKLELLRF